MPDYRDNIRSFFDAQKGVMALYLFGSAAKEKETSASDLDIAVLFEAGSIPDIRSQLDLKENLSALLKKESDLVILNRANPILKYQVFKYGKLLSCKNKRFTHDFLVKSLNEYDDIKRIRIPIEKKILNRRLYGG